MKAVIALVLAIVLLLSVQKNAFAQGKSDGIVTVIEYSLVDIKGLKEKIPDVDQAGGRPCGIYFTSLEYRGSEFVYFLPEFVSYELMLIAPVRNIRFMMSRRGDIKVVVVKNNKSPVLVTEFIGTTLIDYYLKMTVEEFVKSSCLSRTTGS